MIKVSEIGLWPDHDSGNDPAWIVSRDTEDSTETVFVFPVESERLAAHAALELAKKEGLPCVRADRRGQRATIYRPDRD